MECDRRGYVVLRDLDHTHVMPTVCKTWRCQVCQEKLAAMYKLRVQFGCSALGPCYFITVTYVMGLRVAVDALSAVKDLRKLWQRLRSRDRWKNVAWCRVTELTKKGQVHHHLVIGGIEPDQGRCCETVYSRNRGYMRWYRRRCLWRGEECLNHELAREWERITGDSCVVDVDRVRSSRRVSEYLAEYLTKGLAHWDTLEGLGFKRRWNCSRNWPSPGRLRLKGSTDKNKFSVWKEMQRSPRDLLARRDQLGNRARHPTECENIERVGIDLGAPARKKRDVAKIEKLLRRSP